MEKRIQADLVAAMKAKETVRLASLRAIKAAILLAKTAEGGNGEVNDQEIVKIIQKLVKQRKESAQQYIDAPISGFNGCNAVSVSSLPS